jgi:hypothetical protein
MYMCVLFAMTDVRSLRAAILHHARNKFAFPSLHVSIATDVWSHRAAVLECVRGELASSSMPLEYK